MPLVKYHRKTNKTYLSRYGETWVENLNNYSFMSKLCCISDLIRSMIKGGEKIMKGSVKKDDLSILHDKLVLTTKKTTIAWIRKNNYLHQWLLPFNGLQDGTPYAGSSLDNIPRFMPLYHSRNIYVLHSLLFNCVFSRFVLRGEGNDEDEKDVIYLFHPKGNILFTQTHAGIVNGIAFLSKNY